MLQWKCSLRLSLQKGRPHDSSSGSGPYCAWDARDRIRGSCSPTWVAVMLPPPPWAGLLPPEAVVVVVCPLTMSWLAWSNLASGFSVSLDRENDTIKFTPSLDLSEMVGLTSSPNEYRVIVSMSLSLSLLSKAQYPTNYRVPPSFFVLNAHQSTSRTIL